MCKVESRSYSFVNKMFIKICSTKVLLIKTKLKNRIYTKKKREMDSENFDYYLHIKKGEI